MPTQLYTKGNHFYIIESGSTNILFESRGNVKIKKARTDSTGYTVLINNVPYNSDLLEFSDIRDGDNAPYTDQATFETWYEDNTNFKAASGSSGAASPTVGFSASVSQVTELSTSVAVVIPVAVSNYIDTQIDVSISITGGNSEPGDHNFTTTALSFTDNGTQNITFDIIPDAGENDETIIFTLVETSSVTGLVVSRATHTLTVTDNYTAPVGLYEFETSVADTNEVLTEFEHVFNDNPNLLVVKRNNRLYGEVTVAANGTGQDTTFFDLDQGQLNSRVMTFPFEVIALDIGIGTILDPLTSHPVNGGYNFCGLHVHQLSSTIDNNVEFLANINSSHCVVGHRGGTHNCVEFKNTLAGSSSQGDTSFNSLPLGRADLRVTGSAAGLLTWYYKEPGAANWLLINGGTGFPPGTQPTYGASVDVGIIGYAYTNTGLDFAMTCESIQYIQN